MKKPTAKRKAKTTKKKRPGKTKARKHTRKVAKKTTKKAKTAPLPMEYKMQEIHQHPPRRGRGVRSLRMAQSPIPFLMAKLLHERIESPKARKAREDFLRLMDETTLPYHETASSKAHDAVRKLNHEELAKLVASIVDRLKWKANQNAEIDVRDGAGAALARIVNLFLKEIPKKAVLPWVKELQSSPGFQYVKQKERPAKKHHRHQLIFAIKGIDEFKHHSYNLKSILDTQDEADIPLPELESILHCFLDQYIHKKFQTALKAWGEDYLQWLERVRYDSRKDWLVPV